MAPYPYNQLHSHPDRLLADHLTEVGERTQQFVNRAETTPDALSECAYICGVLHDIGKATQYFQQYLASRAISDSDISIDESDFAPEFDPTSDLSLRRWSDKDHAPLGTLVVYYIIKTITDDEELAIAALVAVAKHHGVLPNVSKYVVNTATGDNRREKIERQLDTITPAVAEELDAILETAMHDAATEPIEWSEIDTALRDDQFIQGLEQRYVSVGITPYAAACPETIYDTVMQLWGGLVVADKTSAAGIGETALTSTALQSAAIETHLEEEIWDEHPETLQTKETKTQEEQLNIYRDQARTGVLDRVREFVQHSASIAEITLPTGLGKTYTGLQAALLLRELTAEGDGRLIYALPFTSVIDQTVEDVKDVFSIDHRGNELTVHHHLEDTVTKEEVDDEGGEDTDQNARNVFLLGETWNAGMVVTTYVQLFESLVKPTNRQALKLPSLYNSVIILDEPQALPLDWWRLVRRVTQTLTEEYNATIISMTATQPRLFTSETCDFEVFPLVEESGQYFDAVDRVKYAFDESVSAILERESAPLKSHLGAAETIVSNIDAEQSSALAICNTVDSTNLLSEKLSSAVATAGYEEVVLGDLYAECVSDGTDNADALLDALEQRVEGLDDPFCTLHLTARHRPVDRQVLLDVADALTDAKKSPIDVPFVFTATQLVEAGVDVSFARVYRDFTSMSSIVQAAGRCNRSFEQDTGIVMVWKLAAPNQGRPPSEIVYSDKLGPTISALRAVYEPDQQLAESVVAKDSIEEYYCQLDKGGAGREEYVKMVNEGRFEELQELSLIEEREAYDVFVCWSENELEHATDLTTALGDDDTSAARAVIDKLTLCRISVPKSEVTDSKPAGINPVDINDSDEVLYLWEQDENRNKGYSMRYGFNEEIDI